MDKFFENIIHNQLINEIEFLNISCNLLENDNNTSFNPIQSIDKTKVPFGAPVYKFFCINNILNCMTNINKFLSNSNFGEVIKQTYQIDENYIPNIMSKDIKDLRNLNEHIDERLVDIDNFMKNNNFNGFSDFNMVNLDTNLNTFGIQVNKNFELRLYDINQNLIVFTNKKFQKTNFKITDLKKEIIYLYQKLSIY